MCYLYGETRDHDSCELLTHAVQSGHQVFTTIHAPSAIGIVGRLRSLGASDDVLGSQDFISGLVYQTLCQTLCDHCAIPIKKFKERVAKKGKTYEEEYSELYERIRQVAGDPMETSIRFKGDGCEHCSKGVTGRTVVAEVVVPDNEMIEMFGQQRDMEAWKHWRKNGGISALQTGIDNMLRGECDPYDIEHKLGLLTSDIVMEDGVYDQDNERSLFGFKEE